MSYPQTLALLVLLAPVASAHVGNKDVFEQLSAGPYRLFVTVRAPTVIPGVAAIEVRAETASVHEIHITPLPLAGEASKHLPSPDTMHRSEADPQFFTGSVWLMTGGSWQVRFDIAGSRGSSTVNLPVAAIAIRSLPMQKSLAAILAGGGLFLAIGVAGIVAAAVREARLTPGDVPAQSRRRRALYAGIGSAAAIAVVLYLGGKWWNVEAAAFSEGIYRPLSVESSLSGNQLDLRVGTFNPSDPRKRLELSRSNDDFLPDHGHLMHLYAIRMPGMNAVYHLHPVLAAPGNFRISLPSMPPGHYALYGDVVHANGFPETLTAAIAVPENMRGAPLGAEDAKALPAPIGSIELGTSYALPDGYTMVWDRPTKLIENAAYVFRFRLLTPQGQPPSDMRPYLGMAGHAAFVKTDGTAFAHTHPDGSAAMASLMLANEGSPESRSGMDGMRLDAGEALSNAVSFPYGFPSPGRYRIFVQMKHGNVIETGAFDANVEPAQPTSPAT